MMGQKKSTDVMTDKKVTDLTGQRYGLLTVVEKTHERQDRYVLWRCICDCGGELLTTSKKLKRGTVSNCGCVPKVDCRYGPVAEDLTGQTFGKLTVLHRMPNQNRRTRWMCRCECGVEKAICARELKSGKTKSCGCEQYKRRYVKDIANQRFGRLVALYPTTQRDKKYSVYWHCRCDCGNELEVTGDRLLYGNYKSCGCLKKENQKAIFDKLHMVDGTCVEWLEKRKYRKDNKSGFRGVDQMKNGKYRVTIGFKGQRFYLGIYQNFGEAVQVRTEAEQRLHGSFVKAFYEWKEQADLDPEWAKKNEFTFETGDLYAELWDNGRNHEDIRISL